MRDFCFPDGDLEMTCFICVCLRQKVLTDERMCQSEALYAFLSPSPEHLKVIDIQKKSSFSLASFLERLPGDFFSHQEVHTHVSHTFQDSVGQTVDLRRMVVCVSG